MKASLLTIGDELLSGKTTNTNATWICRNLTLSGCNVVRNVTVRDKEEEILDSLSALFELSVDLVLCTGGLGPTHDDITRNTIFQFFNSDSILDEDYWKNLQKRFSSLGSSISGFFCVFTMKNGIAGVVMLVFQNSTRALEDFF